MRQVTTGYNKRKLLGTSYAKVEHEKLRKIFPIPQSSNQIRVKRILSKDTTFKGWDIHEDDFGDSFL